MPRPSAYVCRDFGRPGCGSVPDDRYTMRFDDIGEEPIYWCTHCGAEAMVLDAIITKASKTQPNFAKAFKEAIDNAYNK